ncbi:lysM domain receptor kinase [Trifolium repens]|nr:lysM domain receptor kinase [Trifolium repens]
MENLKLLTKSLLTSLLPLVCSERSKLLLYLMPICLDSLITRNIPLDVYAFGVVLYELISAKAAVIKIDKIEYELKSLEIKTDESVDEYKSLVALFDEVIDEENWWIQGWEITIQLIPSKR